MRRVNTTVKVLIVLVLLLALVPTMCVVVIVQALGRMIDKSMTRIAKAIITYSNHLKCVGCDALDDRDVVEHEEIEATGDAPLPPPWAREFDYANRPRCITPTAEELIDPHKARERIVMVSPNLAYGIEKVSEEEKALEGDYPPAGSEPS